MIPFFLLLSSMAHASEQPPAAANFFSVVADLERDATYVYDFKEHRFHKNPWSERHGADEASLLDARAKTCEVAKKIGDRVWVVHEMTGRNNTQECEGLACCKI